MKRATLDAIRNARRERRSVALATDLATGAQTLAVAAHEATGIVSADSGETFVQLFAPQFRLIVVGAVHIAQKLVPIAQLADFAVTVIDPRRAFATEDRFPGVTLSHEWPDRALPALAPDAATAIVTLSHDSKVDDPALMAGLRSDAFYIGALGSRRTHAKRLERLRNDGFGDAELGRIRGAGRISYWGRIAWRDRDFDHGRYRRQPAGTRAAMKPAIAGLLLAAGLSRRWGAGNKLLAPIDGVPMIVRSAAILLGSSARPVFAVVGHDGDAVRTALADLPVSFVVAADYAAGLSASLKAGIAALPADCDGALICLGDMPFVQSATLDRLIAAFDLAGDLAALVPTYDGRRGNPVLLGRRLFPDMARLSGDRGARAIFSAMPGCVREVTVDDPGVLRDLDTPEFTESA